MKLDIALSLVNNDYYDISFTEGDYTTTEGLDTALLMSVFSEKRADFSEIPRTRTATRMVGKSF